MTQTTLREYLRTTEDAISSGRYEEAMANCQNILTYFPEALEAQRLLGEVYLAQNRLEEAQQTFEWILTNDPENVIVYCDRALISERTSDIDTALDCYQQAYELSRGSSNIRQAFNQLSVSAGQQEFMFSHAGLARLYMRGDLLTQAIQEWEAVLAISPERLDARLGLMETYWREGLYDKAKQFATQLLEEIPTCLKALLYLAHIASISNIQRARELLERAETLDPELRLAQEIFADLAASAPNDPFLGLIKKDPILLENGTPVNWRAPGSQPSQPVPASVPLSSISSYGNWEMQDDWEKQIPTLLGQSIPETPSRASWEQDTIAFTPPKQSEAEMPTWQAQLEQQPAAEKEQPWYQEEHSTQTNSEPTQNWEKQESTQTHQNGWNNELQENEQPSHPAWLDTLTMSEQNQSIQPLSPAQAGTPSTVQEARATFSTQQEQNAQENEAMPFFFPSESESEEETSWPDWLKSLGAETLEPEQTPSAELPSLEINATAMPTLQTQNQEPSQTVIPTQPQIESDPWAALPAMSTNNNAWTEAENQPEWMQQLSPAEQSPAQQAPAITPDWMQQFAVSQNQDTNQNATPDWMQQFAVSQNQDTNQNATPDWMQQLSDTNNAMSQQENTTSISAEQEENYLASLEDLEKNLQAQGFVPLAPGALSSIAQTKTGELAPVEVQQEATLSSALAQLGNFTQPAAPAASTNAPWWNSMLPPTNEQATPFPPNTSKEQTSPFAALGARTVEEAPRPISPLPATPTPMPVFEPATSSYISPGPALTPAYRSDALLDSDLETTMKRPAIKLQPMQAGENNEQFYAQNKNMAQNERKPIEHNDSANLNSHERLVRGYQYQLAGAYDEAMQEYRLIIRNAPELLDDVISNMRALLKFNPRFSLGYRVLGDAYMRKGEYLQAMESYNKALTMAKKAKN